MSGSAQMPQAAPPFSGDLSEVYVHSRAAEFGMKKEEFVRVLDEVAQKYLPAGNSESQRVDFCRGLKLEELALARACAAGHERAWEVFLTRYREKLYDAARAVARE